MRQVTSTLKAIINRFLIGTLCGSVLILSPGMTTAAHASVPAAERLNAGSSTGLLGTLYDQGNQGWFSNYGPGVKYYSVTAEVGSTVTLAYHVTNESGTAAVNTPVTLKVGKAWSGSNATFTSNYQGAGTIDTTVSAGGSWNGWNPPDGADIGGTTDGSGNISFTLTNTNGAGETRPSDLNASDTLNASNGGVFAQFALLIDGNQESADNQDLVDVHFVAAAQGGGGLPSIRLIPQPVTSGGSADSNDYTSDISQYYSAGSKSYQKYLEGGTTTTLTYQITTDGTTPAGAGQSVKLYANSPYSGSNATWTVNSTSVAAHSAFDGGYGAAVTATTNSQGRVTFTVVNTNTTGFESQPTSATQARPNSGRLYGTFKPVLVNGGTEVGDMAEDTDLMSFDLYEVAQGGGGGGSGATHSTPDHAVLTTSSWSNTGLNGVGPIDDSVRGRTWFINQYYNSSDRWLYAYADAGSTVNLTWHITDFSGAALVNTSVSLRTNFAAGNPNATWTGVGLVNGAMTGTTDSQGNVTFTITNSNTATGSGPSDITSNEAALTNEQGGGFAWSRMSLVVGQNIISADPNTTVNQSTDLLDLIIVPAGSIAAAQEDAAARIERARLAEIEREKTKVKLALDSTAVMSADIVSNVLTCSAPSVINEPTYAAYYLFINHKLIAGKRFGSFTGSPMYPAVDAVTGDATLSSATWGIAPAWNTGRVSTATCAVQIGNASGSTTSMARAVTIARVGKYVKGANKTLAPSAVTMRLVSPSMTKGADGKAIDFVDQSSSPIQDHWSQYYGNAKGGLGVFYKYFTAGSTLTLKYHVTDSASGAALAYFNVWLAVNKNYGGVESATFSYEKNGIKYNVVAHSTDLGETQIPGITDVNGDVTFTLVNTNTAASAEPKPEALNKVQPLTVTPVYSTITLMAHLVSDSETKETKDFIWAHIVKP